MEVTLNLGRGYQATIDAADAELVAGYRWRASVREGGAVYARAYIKEGGKSKTLYLHQLLMNAPAGMVVDHIDHDPLRNVRSNLRWATASSNAQNSRPSRRSRSGVKGVFYHAGTGLWMSQIMARGERKHLGSFKTMEEAAEAYRAAALALHGEFAFISPLPGEGAETAEIETNQKKQTTTFD